MGWVRVVRGFPDLVKRARCCWVPNGPRLWSIVGRLGPGSGLGLSYAVALGPSWVRDGLVVRDPRSFLGLVSSCCAPIRPRLRSLWVPELDRVRCRLFLVWPRLGSRANPSFGRVGLVSVGQTGPSTGPTGALIAPNLHPTMAQPGPHKNPNPRLD